MASKLDIVAGDGYFTVATSIRDTKLKVRVFFAGQLIDTYNFVEKDAYPLVKGSGKYIIELYQQIVGNRYRKVAAKMISAKLSREDAAFLCSNQYVKYSDNMRDISIQLRKDRNDEDFLAAVRQYMKTHFNYDFIYAIQVPKTGVLPDIARLEKKKMGICQDLAAYAAGILRQGGLPAKMVIGYVENCYHAWIETEFGIYDPTVELGAMSPKPKNTDYKGERYY